jgi:FixJ family two-component response regulator
VALPGLSGFSIAFQLQEHEIGLPLVFFTGTPWGEVKAKTENLRTKMAYVEKPFSKRALLKKMAELLNGMGWLHRDA